MNIFDIQQELIAIFDELEENGGELTPELEAKLAITEDEFKDKVESYTNVIKSLNHDIDLIKCEQNRLKNIANSKQKTIDKLSNIILNAITLFGEEKKNGVKYLDYGTGIVSTRKSESVEVDTKWLDSLTDALYSNINYMKAINQLDVVDKIDVSELITSINTDYIGENEGEHSGYNATEADINHTNVAIEVKVPCKDLLSGNAYAIVRELAKYCDSYKLNAEVSKSEIKKELKENGACAPNLARLVTNQSIQIK